MGGVKAQQADFFQLEFKRIFHFFIKIKFSGIGFVWFVGREKGQFYRMSAQSKMISR